MNLRTRAKRICIFAREHIGDVVNATGAIHTIRLNCPEAFIAVSLGENVASALANSPDFDLIVPRPKRRTAWNKLRYILRLRNLRFDAAVILDEATSQVRNARAAGIGTIAGVAHPGSEKRFDASVTFDRNAHDSRDQYVNLLNALCFSEVSDKPCLYPSKEDQAKADAAIEGLPRPIVALHPGASEPTRRWVPERFGEVAADLTNRGLSVVVTGSGAEKELCASVVAASGSELRNLAGSLSILEFAALAKRLDAVIVGDTGPMHIAAAVGTPTIVPYGPTYPHLTGPYGSGHRILQGACPCPRRDWSTCSYACMRDVSVERVVAAALEVVT